MKKKIISIIILVMFSFLLASCENSNDSSNNNKESTSENVQNVDDSEKDESELSQSEWMEEHGDDYEDGYEVVDAINIDSGDTKLKYISNEKYTLESGEEVLLVNFTFSNINAGNTNLDSEYNFSAFQDGVEIDVYSTLFDEVEGDSNRSKEILDGASIDVSIGIATDNWESPIKLRVDDCMMYDDAENMGNTFQQQEIELK